MSHRPSRRSSFRLALAALVLGAAVPGAAGDPAELDYGVRVGLGVDSNPLEIRDDGSNSVYTALGLDAGVEKQISARLRLFSFGAVTTRFHEGRQSNADDLYGSVRGGMQFTPFAQQRGRLVLAVGGGYAVRDSTYTDRATGDVYLLPSVLTPPDVVRIADRYDYDTTDAFARVSWKVAPRVRLSLRARLSRSSYGEDYTISTGLDSLDNRAFSLEPDVTFYVNDSLSVRFAAEITDLDYDDRSALGLDGLPVADTQREYHYARYRLQFRMIPADRWRLRFGLSHTNRDDTFVGYYDYDSQFGFLTVDRKLGESDTIRLHASISDLAYDRATVPGMSADDTRNNDVLRVVGRYSRKIREHLGWYAETGAERTDSRDPVYAYDRDWVETGIRFRR